MISKKGGVPASPALEKKSKVMREDITKILEDATSRMLDAETNALRHTLICGGIPKAVANTYFAVREYSNNWVILKDGKAADGATIVRILSDEQVVSYVKRVERIVPDYTKAPWRESAKELPDGSGRRCICYIPQYGEVEMIFHRSRPDSGYKDFFTECAGGRAYDYDYIKYWRYYTDEIEG